MNSPRERRECENGGGFPFLKSNNVHNQNTVKSLYFTHKKCLTTRISWFTTWCFWSKLSLHDVSPSLNLNQPNLTSVTFCGSLLMTVNFWSRLTYPLIDSLASFNTLLLNVHELLSNSRASSNHEIKGDNIWLFKITWDLIKLGHIILHEIFWDKKR